MLEIGAGERERELLAAVSSEDVARPQVLTPAARNLLQEPIASLVTVVVVVLLEPVQVEDRDAERRAAAICPGELAAKLLVPGAAIEQPG
jgi:hypothetical protein